MAELKLRLGRALSHLDELSAAGVDNKLHNILKLIIETQDALIDEYNAHTHNSAVVAPPAAEQAAKSGIAVQPKIKMIP